MFLVGCELRADRLRGRGRVVGFVALATMGLPFLTGLGVSIPLRDIMIGASARPLAYELFFGLAISITALPVLARILVDSRLADTRIGILALTCAGIDDAMAWTTLAFVLALDASAGGSGAVATLGLALTVALFALLCVRPALAAFVRWAQQRPGAERVILPVLLTGAFGFATATQLIGLDAIIGAFLFGAVVPRDSVTVQRIGEKLEGFAVSVLLPLFFAGVGLHTSVGLLGSSAAHWLMFVAILVGASASKFLGATGAARLSGTPVREALTLGALMNCRGITELVIASIGLTNHLINGSSFTILVLVALISTAVTGPLVRLFTRGASLPTEAPATT
jgi:Kef-type K+ transport system membrane component KefB